MGRFTLPRVDDALLIAGWIMGKSMIESILRVLQRKQTDTVSMCVKRESNQLWRLCLKELAMISKTPMSHSYRIGWKLLEELTLWSCSDPMYWWNSLVLELSQSLFCSGLWLSEAPPQDRGKSALSHASSQGLISRLGSDSDVPSFLPGCTLGESRLRVK